MSELQTVRLRSVRFWDPDFHFSIFVEQHPNSSDSKFCYQRNFWKIVLFLEGHGTEMIDGIPYPFTPGMLFVIHPDDVTNFKIASGQKIKVCNIIFPQSFLAFAEPLFSRNAEFLNFFQLERPSLPQEKRERYYIQTASPAIMSLVQKMLKEFEQAKEMFESILQLELLELLCLIIREGERKSRKNSMLTLAQRVMAELQEQYPSQINMTYFSRKFGVSRQYLTRCFRAAYGVGIIKHLQKIRLEAACRLLHSETERENIAEIASRCGFRDLSYFYRIFRAEFGASPGSRLRNTEKS